MSLLRLVLCLLIVPTQAKATTAVSSRYMWYRSMNASARRMFGGEGARLSRFGAAGALLDRTWTSRCSATVLTPRWALSAGHCITPHVHYVQFNTYHPSIDAQHLAIVQKLYRHPEYKVQISNEDSLPDVTLLHHDIGLVHTQTYMNLMVRTRNLLVAIPLHKPSEFRNREVELLGFGRSERGAIGEQLWAVRLVVEFCARRQWVHCACARGSGRGVCAGDSGGPVVWRGALVGVTSMGPAECGAGGVAGNPWDSSVFTTLYQYAEILNNTVYGNTRKHGIKMVAYQAAESNFRSSVELLVLSISCSVLR